MNNYKNATSKTRSSEETKKKKRFSVINKQHGGGAYEDSVLRSTRPHEVLINKSCRHVASHLKFWHGRKK